MPLLLKEVGVSGLRAYNPAINVGNLSCSPGGFRPSVGRHIEAAGLGNKNHSRLEQGRRKLPADFTP